MCCMSEESFHNAVELSDLADHAPSRGQRKGQYASNLFHHCRPDLAILIAGTDVDPFYQDERLPAFYAWVKEHWDDPVMTEAEATALNPMLSNP